MESLNLTPLEKAILEKSSDPNLTKRRIKSVLIASASFILVLLYCAFKMRSWQVITTLCVGYILITTFEKISYGNAVLGYKSLIQKLLKQIDAKST